MGIKDGKSVQNKAGFNGTSLNGAGARQEMRWVNRWEKVTINPRRANNHSLFPGTMPLTHSESEALKPCPSYTMQTTHRLMGRNMRKTIIKSKSDR